jgi:hypothetical protein
MTHPVPLRMAKTSTPLPSSRQRPMTSWPDFTTTCRSSWELEGAWLDLALTKPPDVLDMLSRSTDLELDAYPVSRLVNRPSMDCEVLIQPVESVTSVLPTGRSRPRITISRRHPFSAQVGNRQIDERTRKRSHVETAGDRRRDRWV